MCGDAAQNRDDRRVRDAVQPIRDAHICEYVAVMQAQRLRQHENALMQLRNVARDVGSAGIIARIGNSWDFLQTLRQASLQSGPLKPHEERLCAAWLIAAETAEQIAAHLSMQGLCPLSQELAPFRPIGDGRWLPRLRRAFPSAGLDVPADFRDGAAARQDALAKHYTMR